MYISNHMADETSYIEEKKMRAYSPFSFCYAKKT